MSTAPSNSSERKTKFCQNCGAIIDIKAEICPKCGVRVAPPPVVYVKSAPKNPLAALIFSFLFPGLGHIYNGQIKFGVFLMLGMVLCLVISALSIFLFFIPLMVWISAMYDAYTSAEKINKEAEATGYNQMTKEYM
jgi:TM2 domain-containing membrane protein YozV/ribosomal protein L40E